jgi:cation diffusion facilitator CzcD-associated flavoprotein CzcO
VLGTVRGCRASICRQGNWAVKLSEKARAMGMDESRIRRALGIGVNPYLVSDLIESTDAWNSLLVHAAAYDHPGKVVHVVGVGGSCPPDADGRADVRAANG